MVEQRSARSCQLMRDSLAAAFEAGFMVVLEGLGPARGQFESQPKQCFLSGTREEVLKAVQPAASIFLS